MYSVLVADDNVHWQESLCAVIGKEEIFGPIWGTNNPEDAIGKIEKYLPDIVILDIVMPNYDGIWIGEHIKNNIPDYNPIIYIISGFATSSVIERVNALDVNFFSLKPISLDVAIGNLKRLIQKSEDASEYDAVAQKPIPEVIVQKSIAEMVEEILRELGLPPHLQSSKCAKEALIAYINSPVDMRMLSKAIYPEIAKKFGSTAGGVEKNIREAVSYIVENQSSLYKKIFSFYNKKKITNSIFFFVLAEYINKC